MAKMITVEAVKGQLLPMPGRPGAFVGMKRLKASDDSSECWADIPGGFRWGPSGPVTVEASPYYTRALSKGALVMAKVEEEKPKRRASSAEKEG